MSATSVIARAAATVMACGSVAVSVTACGASRPCEQIEEQIEFTSDAMLTGESLFIAELRGAAFDTEDTDIILLVNDYIFLVEDLRERFVEGPVLDTDGELADYRAGEADPEFLEDLAGGSLDTIDELGILIIDKC